MSMPHLAQRSVTFRSRDARRTGNCVAGRGGFFSADVYFVLQAIDEHLQAVDRLECLPVDVGDEVDHTHSSRHELNMQHGRSVSHVCQCAFVRVT